MVRAIHIIIVIVALGMIVIFFLFSKKEAEDIPMLSKIRVCENNEDKICEEDNPRIKDDMQDIIISFESKGFNLGYSITLDYYMSEGSQKVELFNAYYPVVNKNNSVVLVRPYDSGWLNGKYEVRIKPSYIASIEGVNNLFTKMFYVSPF